MPSPAPPASDPQTRVLQTALRDVRRCRNARIRRRCFLTAAVVVTAFCVFHFLPSDPGPHLPQEKLADVAPAVSTTTGPRTIRIARSATDFPSGIERVEHLRSSGPIAIQRSDRSASIARIGAGTGLHRWVTRISDEQLFAALPVESPAALVKEGSGNARLYLFAPKAPQ